MKQFFLVILLTMATSILPAQTIFEKKASLRQIDSDFDAATAKELEEANNNLEQNHALLKQAYKRAQTLFDQGAEEESFTRLLNEIQELKQAIASSESSWRETAAEMGKEEENYSLWNQPETSLSQLVMDYGASDFVYLIPPEIGSLNLSVNSTLPIPRESWKAMLEHILNASGVGIRQLNPYLRQLYLLNENGSSIKLITNKREDLTFLPSKERVCFLLSPKALSSKEALLFLKKFTQDEQAVFHPLGQNILIFSTVFNLSEILKLYDFVETEQKGRDYRVVALKRVDASEMQKILQAIFSSDTEDERDEAKESWTSLKIVKLENHPRSLFIMGAKDEVRHADEIIQDVEEQVAGAQEKAVEVYTCKYSEPEELAKVLERVYPSMLTERSLTGDEELGNSLKQNSDDEKSERFIVDAKTGSIIMVVGRQTIPALKELLKKIDIPKQMVRIEVLLVEKKIRDNNRIGLNLLKTGSQSANTTANGIRWNDATADGSAGILSFLLSRTKSSRGIPAYDLTYNFLLSQENIQINASPSVTTVNQTPALIEIVDEISIKTGTQQQTDDAGNNRFTDTSVRKDYGIVIEITPTVHMSEEGEENSVTLTTDIKFDSPGTSTNQQPDVTKRHIKNEVRIDDGQTVIIGGLRRKDITDTSSKIPFLGEIPGFGKLFGTTTMEDKKTELFIILTPKIIVNPSEDHSRVQRELMKRRLGDIPEFMRALEDARRLEKKRLFEGTIKTLFGRTEEKPSFYGEYDGR